MIPELALPRPLAYDEEHAAATAIRHTGTRLGAPETDIALVIDVLFQEPQS